MLRRLRGQREDWARSCLRCHPGTRNRPPRRTPPSIGSRCPACAAIGRPRSKAATPTKTATPTKAATLTKAAMPTTPPPPEPRSTARPCQSPEQSPAGVPKPPAREATPADWCSARAARGRQATSASGGWAWPEWSFSSFLPVVESFGLAVVEAVPWHFHFGSGGPDAYVDDMGLRVDTPVMGPGGFDPAQAGPRLVDALEAVLSGRGELGPLNRLVVGAGLDWREVALLGAYCAYRRVVGGQWATEAADGMSEALVAFPSSAAAVVRLFLALLVPEPGPTADEARICAARSAGQRPRPRARQSPA